MKGRFLGLTSLLRYAQAWHHEYTMNCKQTCTVTLQVDLSWASKVGLNGERRSMRLTSDPWQN